MPAFDVYRSIGPTIDVRLFGDAAVRGAQLGKLIPNPISSAIEGAKEGYKYGLDVETQSQQNEIRQHQIDQQPTADQQAQATLEHTRAVTKKLEEELKYKESALVEQTKLMELQNRNSKATEELKTYGVFNEIEAGFKSSNPNQVIGAITNPNNQQVIFNKPEEALQVMARLDQAGADKSKYDPLRQSIVSAMRQKAAANRTTEMAGSDEKQALKEKEDFNSGRSAMRAVYSDLATSPDMDPRKAFVGLRSGVTADGKYIVPTPDNRTERTAAGVPRQYLNDETPVALYDGKIVKELPENVARDLGKAIFDVQTYYSSNKLYDGLPSPTASPTSNSLPQVNGPVTVPTLTGVQGPITGDNIVEVVKARKLAAQAQAKANGTQDSFVAASKRAEGIVTSKIPQTSGLSAPQNTPLPTNQVPVTKQQTSSTLLNTPTKGVYTPTAIESGLSSMMGAPVVIDQELANTGDVSAKHIAKVNSIPELRDASALIKALVTVESGGNPRAVSPVGAQGLTQLMPGTAREVGVTDPFDIPQNVKGGAVYLQKKIDSINNTLTRKFSEQGIPIVADPRIALAAYNGGSKWTAKYINNAVSAGAVTWEDFQKYLLNDSGKSRENAQTNINYANKVALTTLAYLKGGNVADDLIAKTWANFGMIHVG